MRGLTRLGVVGICVHLAACDERADFCASLRALAGDAPTGFAATRLHQLDTKTEDGKTRSSYAARLQLSGFVECRVYEEKAAGDVETWYRCATLAEDAQRDAVILAPKRSKPVLEKMRRVREDMKKCFPQIQLADGEGLIRLWPTDKTWEAWIEDLGFVDFTLFARPRR